MKKFKFSAPLLLVAVVAMFFVSCSKNTATHIPADAFAVLVLDGDELLKFSDTEFIKENPEYEEMMEEVEDQSEKAAELIEEMLDNPDASGVLITEKSYAFATIVDEEILVGVVIPIDRGDLEDNLEMIGDEFKVDVTDLMESKDDIQYMSPEDGMIFGWNDDVFMFLFMEDGEDLYEYLDKYMNLKKKESILSDKDFKKFHKNCVAMNLWVSSNVIDNIDLDIDEIEEFEELTGIDLANNYGHMHLDLQKDEITFTSKLRFNESIQELDKKKLMDNAEKLMELFEDPISSGMDIFGGNNKYDEWDDDYYDDYYDDDEWDDEWDEDYEEMTDEEWEELLNELEEEIEETE